MKSQEQISVYIDELHRHAVAEARIDIGNSALTTVVATGGKRNIRLVLANQDMSGFPEGLLGNMACRIITKLANPKCIWTARKSSGLTEGQAAKLAELQQQEILVQYADHPSPFWVRVDDILLPEAPDDASLKQIAQAFLSCVAWTEDSLKSTDVPDSSLPSRDPDALTSDGLRIFLRIAGHSAEPILDRCDALGMGRPHECRERKPLEAKGIIEEIDITLGKAKFYRVTAKGMEWAKRHGIKAKQYRYKSGPVHEYILAQVEKQIGGLNTKFHFQRHSQIAREHRLQPDSLLLLPGGQRVIIEICCHNFAYEARNLVKETQTEGVDLVIAVVPNQRLKRALHRALDRCDPMSRSNMKPLVVLDAGTCLTRDFDWHAVLEKAT